MFYRLIDWLLDLALHLISWLPDTRLTHSWKQRLKKASADRDEQLRMEFIRECEELKKVQIKYRWILAAQTVSPELRTDLEASEAEISQFFEEVSDDLPSWLKDSP